MLRPVLIGALTGVGYGAALRAWMRLVSTEPEFSLSGTGYIVGVLGVLGAAAGLVTAARRAGWHRRLVAARVVGIVLSLGCFVAAGVMMLPTIVPAALARGRTDWPRPVRAGLLAVAVAAAVGVVLTLPGMDAGRRLLALTLYLVLCPVEVELTARLYAPSLPRGSLGRIRLVGLVVGATILAGLMIALLGTGLGAL